MLHLSEHSVVVLATLTVLNSILYWEITAIQVEGIKNSLLATQLTRHNITIRIHSVLPPVKPQQPEAPIEEHATLVTGEIHISPYSYLQCHSE